MQSKSTKLAKAHRSPLLGPRATIALAQMGTRHWSADHMPNPWATPDSITCPTHGLRDISHMTNLWAKPDPIICSTHGLNQIRRHAQQLDDMPNPWAKPVSITCPTHALNHIRTHAQIMG